MQVGKHKVVSIDYTLTDDDGQIIDTSQGAGPLNYLHGEGNIIPGLERALEGKAIGDHVRVSVEPADGYGERRDELRQVVSRDSFEDAPDLQIGMRFRAPAEDDSYTVITVVEIDDDTVTIDGNHVLAGVRLNFDVKIREVRDATSEEISQGHAE
jgi:FKBP-type peptidyl-prolyl cis-trans isomerase SlyD